MHFRGAPQECDEDSRVYAAIFPTDLTSLPKNAFFTLVKLWNLAGIWVHSINQEKHVNLVGTIQVWLEIYYFGVKHGVNMNVNWRCEASDLWTGLIYYGDVKCTVYSIQSFLIVFIERCIQC